MTDTRIVPLELLQDLRDLASDAVEHHRQAFVGYKYDQQERIDKVILSVDKLLAAAPQAEQFCDANCTWLDHHPDCEIGKAEQAGGES